MTTHPFPSARAIAVVRVLDLQETALSKSIMQKGTIDWHLCENVYLSHKRVLKYDGAGMGKLLMDALLELGLTEAQIRTGLRSACYDGEYCHTQVNNTFNIHHDQ